MADVLQNAPVIGMKKRFPRSFGRYVLEKSVSRGGMGEVILAVAKGVNRHCIIKTIRGDLVGDEEFIGRFADEAKIMVRISHNNIIRVFDAGKVDSEYYIAMEFVHGRDLGDILDRAYERGEPVPTQVGLFITAELLKGLHYAHSLTDERGRHMGLVHRDISPQNVLIGFDGSVKLIDFGLARTEVLPGRTQGALAVGKYGYMSPEQARHESIDGRADIYSTGVMLFELFTGDRLVDEQDQATLWTRVLSPQHRRPRAVLPSLPPDIDKLVMTAVGVRPEDRFRDANEMLRFVQRMQRPESNKDAFLRYLSYLYPKVDFTPPALPSFDGGLINETHEEKSVIIATSREGALSVFGRGELPIEWTRQIPTDEVQRELRKRRQQSGRNYGRKPSLSGFERDVVTDTHETEAGDVSALNPNLVAGPSVHDVPGIEDQLDAPTMVATFPIDPLAPSTDEIPFSRPPTPTAELTSPPLKSPPVMNLSAPASTAFRDDEMTVMMDAPPRNAIAPSQPIESEENETPTRLSRSPDPEVSIPPPKVSVQPGPPSANRGRAIRELNRAEPVKEVRRDPAEQRAKRKQFAVHRQTVGAQAEAPKRPRRDPAENFNRTDGGDITAPVAPSSSTNYLLIGAILMGLALCVVVAIMIVLFA